LELAAVAHLQLAFRLVLLVAILFQLAVVAAAVLMLLGRRKLALQVAPASLTVTRPILAMRQ
jgi:hypothetical protein